MNRYIGVGRVAKDPVLREAPSKVRYLTFILRIQWWQVMDVDKRRKARGLDIWTTVVGWPAERLAPHLRGGDLVQVEGHLEELSFSDHQGHHFPRICLKAFQCRFLSAEKQAGLEADLPTWYPAQEAPAALPQAPPV